MEVDQVKNLIQSLKSGDDPTKLRAVKELIKQSKEDPNIKSVFAKNKGISALVKTLQKTRNAELLQSVLDLLNDLCTKSHYAANMAKKSAVSILLPLFSPTYPASLALPAATLLHTLTSDKYFSFIKETSVPQDVMRSLIGFMRVSFAQATEEVKRLVIVVIGTMGRFEAAQEMFIKDGGVEPLLQALRVTVPKDENAQHIARTIGVLIVNPVIGVEFGKGDGLGLLFNLLKDGTQTTKQHVLRAMSNLAFNSENQDGLVKLGAVPVIVNLLSNPALCELAAACLRFLAAGHTKCQQIVQNSGGIPLLMDMIKGGTNNGKAQAALAIFFLVQQKPIQDVAAASIPLLVSLISNDDEHCKINAIKALGSLAKKHAGNKAAIVAQNGITKIIQYLKAQKEKRGETTEALGNVAGIPATNNLIIGQDGLPLLLDIIKSTDNNEKSAASETLAVILETSANVDMNSLLPPQEVALPPVISSFISSSSLTLLTILQDMIASNNTNSKYASAHLLSVLSFFGITFPNVSILHLATVVNAEDIHSTYAMRVLHHKYLANPELSTTDLQLARPGLINALRTTDSSLPPTHAQLATLFLMRLLADPSVVATLAPQVDIQRVVTEFARNGDAYAVRIGADAIWTLLESDTQWESAVVQGGGIRPCVRLLTSKEDDLLRAGLSIARILAFAYGDEIAREGGVSALMSVVMEQQDLQLRSLAAQTLWLMLVNGSQAGREDLASEGGVDVLVEFLSGQVQDKSRSPLNLQIKSFIEQSLFLLRAAGGEGYTSLIEGDSKYHRICNCEGISVQDGPFLIEQHDERGYKLQTMYADAAAELTLHKLSCNSANEFYTYSILHNILLFVKYIPEKVVRELNDHETLFRFISITWMQPELIGIGIKILTIFTEKGLTIPNIPLVEILAAQIRSFPQQDADIRGMVEQCTKMLNAAAKYPTKEPFYAQLTELRNSQSSRDSTRETEVRDLKAQSAHLTDKVSELASRLHELDARCTKEANTVKQLQAEKKQSAEALAKKEARVQELEADILKLNTNITTLTSSGDNKLADAQREIQKLKQELHKTASMKDKEEKETQKDRKISELQTEISRMKNQTTAEKKAVLELEAMVEKVTHENSEISSRLLTLEDDHNSTLAQLEEKQKLLLEAQQQIHPRGNQKLAEILDSINPTLVHEMAEIENLEAMLDAKLHVARARKYQILKQVTEKMKEMVHCPICMEKNRNVTLTPCGHTYCSDCARSIAEKAAKKCPICRKPIKATQPIYL